MSADELPQYDALLDALREIFHETGETALAFRAEAQFEGAFHRSSDLSAYADASPSAEALAAALAAGLIANRPLAKHNVRAAAAAFVMTLLLNGRRLDVAQHELAATFKAFSAGETSEQELAAWAKANGVDDDRFA